MGDNAAVNANTENPPQTGDQGQGDPQRTRRTFYLDSEVITAVDRSHKQVNHQMYPAEVTKSVFLEALLRYGLDNIEEIKGILHDLIAQRENQPR